MVIKTPATRIPRGRRAVSDRLKQDRREDLRAAALRLLSRRAYEDITMQAVAAEAGVAKGTSYLYFRTREALFLSLLADHYAAWFEYMQTHTAAAPADGDARAWAAAVARDLAGRPLFLRLAGLLHRVLERNVPVHEIVAFKRELAARMSLLAAWLETSLGLRAGAGERLLLWLQAAAPALAQMAEPAPPLAQALQAEPALARLQVDFCDTLENLLAALVRGLRSAEEIPS